MIFVRGVLLASLMAFGTSVFAQRLEIGSKEQPSQALMESLGTYRSKPIFSSYVFINGLYVKLPYVVEYKANVVYINGQVIDFQRLTGVPVATSPSDTVRKPQKKSVKDMDADEFFTIEDDPPAQVATTPSTPVESSDAFLLDEDELVTQSTASDAKGQQARSVADDSTVVSATREAFEKQKQTMLRLVKSYEERLQQGCLLMVGRTHQRMIGTEQTGRQLITVLPKAMRATYSGKALLKELENQGVYFLDEPICEAIMRNRLSFIAIDQRRMKLQSGASSSK